MTQASEGYRKVVISPSSCSSSSSSSSCPPRASCRESRAPPRRRPRPSCPPAAQIRAMQKQQALSITHRPQNTLCTSQSLMRVHHESKLTLPPSPWFSSPAPAAVLTALGPSSSSKSATLTQIRNLRLVRRSIRVSSPTHWQTPAYPGHPHHSPCAPLMACARRLTRSCHNSDVRVGAGSAPPPPPPARPSFARTSNFSAASRMWGAAGRNDIDTNKLTECVSRSELSHRFTENTMSTVGSLCEHLRFIRESTPRVPLLTPAARTTCSD